jgi:hypothetical protein
VRIQVLGFRRYLEDARSHQFSYIDAAGTFREYLPWAVVFGIEQHWAGVFAELDVVAQGADLHLAQDLRWFAGIKGPEDALTPTTERPEAEATPRRLALIGDTAQSDADADTVLVPAQPTLAEPASPKIAPDVPHADEVPVTSAAPRVIDAVPLAPAPAPVDEVLVERFATPPSRRGALAVLAAAGTRVARATKLFASDTGRGLVIMAKGAGHVTSDLVHRGAALVHSPRPRSDEPTLRIPVGSPATPVRPSQTVQAPLAPVPVPATVGGVLSDPVGDEAPAVRQWVPRPSGRPAALKPRPRPAMPVPEPAHVPAAPVTPRRPPRVEETPAAASLPTPVAPRPATPRKRATAQGQLPPWSDWLDEFDLAMSGDFDADGPDATDGGTVISGPERFDVLLAVPLWPDVPLDSRPDHRVG